MDSKEMTKDWNDVNYAELFESGICPHCQQILELRVRTTQRFKRTSDHHGRTWITFGDYIKEVYLYCANCNFFLSEPVK